MNKLLSASSLLSASKEFLPDNFLTIFRSTGNEIGGNITSFKDLKQTNLGTIKFRNEFDYLSIVRFNL